MTTERMGTWRHGLELPKKHGEKQRKPLRTLQELADEFGISAVSLKTRLQHDEAGPKPLFYTNPKLGTRKTWYDPQQVRKWYKERYKA